MRNSLLAIILIVTLCPRTSVRAIPSRSPGETKPRTIEIQVGGSANITCRMNIQVFIDKNSSSLSFFEENTEIDVPRDDLSIINETTIVYMIRNATQQTSRYVCKSDSKGIDTTHVYVGTPPTDVTDFACRGYDFTYMVCNFTVPKNMIFTKYKLHYTAQSPNYIHECSLDSGDLPSLRVCNLTLDKSNYRPIYEFYNFSLTGTNSLGSRTQIFWINHHDSIIPAKPEIIFEEVTTNSVILSWHVIKYSQYRPKGLEYEIQVRPENFDWLDITAYELRYNKSEFKVKIEKLDYAYRKYDVSVRVKVKTAKNDGTMWSEPFLGSFRTEARRPDNPPKTDVGSFCINTADTSLRLYWQQLPEYRENGPNFSYIVTDVKRDGKSVNILPTEIDRISATYPWNSHSLYEFTLKSRNDIGESLDSSHIRVLPMKRGRSDHTPQWIRKVYHNQMYTLSWSPPENRNNMINYTVFWCVSKMESPNQCKSTIYFKHLHKNTQNYTTEPQGHSLNLAISANYADFNTGMQWAMCTAEISSDLMKLDPEMTPTSSRSIKVQWSSECIYTSILEGYNLTYCQVANNVSVDLATCLDVNATTVTVETTAKEYEIIDLKPFSTYKIEIFMFSKVKKGPVSDALLATTTEDAPTPPRHLKYRNITSNSAIISWLPPKQTNGYLRFYTVWQNNEQHFVNISNPTGNETNDEITFKLENLSSFSEYKVYVTAQTIETSSPSNDIHFKTLIGIPSNPRHINVLKKNTHVSLYWEKPLVPSGRVEFYEVSVTVSRNNIVDRRRVTRVKGFSCQLTLPACVDPQYSHSLEVRAVNVATRNEIDHHTFSKRDTQSSIATQSSQMANGKARKIRRIPPEQQVIATEIVANTFENDYEGNDDLKCVGEEFNDESVLRSYTNTNLYKNFKSGWERGPIYACGQIKFSEVTTIALVVVMLSLGMMTVFYLLRNKYNKMKNIDCVIPPGLETHPSKESENNIAEKEDIHRSEESLYHKENHHLLASICNDSGYLNRGQCSIGKSSGYVGSDHSENSSEQCSQNTDPLELNDISCMAPKPINLNDENQIETASKSTISSPLSPAAQLISPENGYIKPTMMMPNIGASGYVQPQFLQKSMIQPSFNGYTTLDAMGKPILPAAAAANIPSFSTFASPQITPAAAEAPLPPPPPPPTTNGNRLISGYVTHKQLSVFGQQRLQ